MLAEALARMPHAGAMRLIAAIEHADRTGIRCRAMDHAALRYPLRLDGVLHAAALVELGAQAAAAHASVFGMGSAHTGLVLTLSDIDLRCSRIDDPGILCVRAWRLDEIEGAVAYRFEVTQSEGVLVAGEILLSMVAA